MLKFMSVDANKLNGIAEDMVIDMKKVIILESIVIYKYYAFVYLFNRLDHPPIF